MKESSSPREARVLLRLQWVIFAAWAVYTVLNALKGRPRTATFEVFVSLFTLALVALVVRWPHRWKIALHLTAASCCVALVVLAWWSGGPLAVAWWFLVAVPPLAAHVGGQRAGWAWAVLASIAAVAATTVSFGTVEFTPTATDRATGGAILVWISASFALLARGVADAQLAQIERAAQARADLLATIGHEVRTPLHGMVGTAAILAETELAPEQREMLATIRSSGAALRKIVDDVLDVARLDAGRLAVDPHPVDLCAIVEDVVDLFAGDASTRGVALFAVAPSAVEVEVDGARVRQILANLVGNAVKFTEEGHVAVRLDAVRLEAAAGEGERLGVSISVEDTGPGVDVAKLGALFTAFQQPDARLARLHGGSGLGLSLSRHLAERLGGTLEADADRAVGARFVLRMELPTTEAIDRLPAPVGLCLMVEAEAVFEESHRASAAALGVQLQVAASAQAAIAAARESPPRLVLISDSARLDVGAAVRALREELGPAVPIVHVMPPVQLGGELPYTELFHGTTLKPLRRSRLRALYEEAELTRDSPSAARCAGSALVLDDDLTSRRIMTMFLERRGFSVTPLADGVAGLETLLAERVDLVLCDLNMPEMDGVEVIRRAVAMSSTRETTFAMVTASTLAEDRRRALAAGAHVFMTKPFDPARIDELVALVRHRAGGALDAPAPPMGAPPLDGPSQRAVGVESRLIDEPAFAQMQELLGEEHGELYDDLLTEGRKHLSTLRTSSDIAELERAAHTIASATLQAAFEAVGERARQLELSLRERSPDERLAEVEALETLFAASFEAIGRPVPIRPSSILTGPAHLSFEGHLTEATVQRELGRLVRSGRPVRRLLIECSAMTSYDPSARDAFERWMAGIELERVAIVTKNRLWVAVVGAMGTATSRPMRAFRRADEAAAWLAIAAD